ncbi:MAG: polymer-forming cytoskeletal protein [Alphaproteobacteria bacterium]|nr:polymer-forming cytoskeletal protein [Alphaproteobacteria bacterium]MBU1513520.1 polymer-forming cytoskeletal protein [Alphaproteobacteria bacterium]MBU2094835.1 polymer-forming cytoskeletal protein [Alphaproteobacteria bacterium]MBU2151092.1 polymer-forming cytoskeletal protein [Alphaproteobacteria bacterium]MBU2309375.1 polymer-forming cytoskeletal protein [Alphaproteobacteria bacterium]
MFSKPQTKGGSAPNDTPQPRKLTVASLVAEGVSLRGDLTTEGDLHLDGALEGDLRVGQLTIGESGSVSGSILADSIEVRGSVTGTICARQVRLWATARVDGDISHTELSIEAGAHFEGRSLALTPTKPAALEALTVVAAE